MNKVWEFVKKNWVTLIAFLGSAIAAILFLDKKEKDKTASDAEEEARKASYEEDQREINEGRT